VKVYEAPWAQERGRYWMYTDTYEEYVHPSKVIHGYCDFKDQAWSYTLAHAPRDAVIEVREDIGNLNPSDLESAPTELSQFTGLGISVPGSMSRYEQPFRQTPNSPVIGASYSIPKTIFAIAQLTYATSTLYQTRKNQIDTFGYSAFGLTVIPYALMSLINLLGNILTPDYHALYLVASDVMDEAMRRGARFDGVVGRLAPDTDSVSATAEVLPLNTHKLNGEILPTGDKEKDSIVISCGNKEGRISFPASIVDYSSPPLPNSTRRKYQKKKVESISKDPSPSIFVPSCSKFRRMGYYNYNFNVYRTQMTYQGAFSFTPIIPSTGYRSAACLANAIVVLAIIGAMTKFEAGSATTAQENWTLHWYIFGAIYGGFSLEDLIRSRPWPELDWGEPVKRDSWVMILPWFLYGVPAIGGFVVVVQMMIQYGICTSV
jgi:hypothetical protein